MLRQIEFYAKLHTTTLEDLTETEHKSCKNKAILDFCWALAIALWFQFSMKFSKFSLEVEFVRSRNTNICTLETCD